MQNSKLKVKSVKLKVARKSTGIVKARNLKTEAKLQITKPTRKTGLTVEVYDTKGVVIDKVALPQEIFGVKVNKILLSQAIRVYLANQRLGTHKTKDRGEVHGTTKKVWQQKGTGRARHGSRKAPIFVHGGVAFGPQPRDYGLKLSKRMRRLALFSALSSKLKDKELKIVAGLEKIKPKTKLMAKVLKSIGQLDEKKVLLVTPGGNGMENVYRASRNIQGVRIQNATILNAYNVLDNKMVILMKDAIDSIKNNFLKE